VGWHHREGLSLVRRHLPAHLWWGGGGSEVLEVGVTSKGMSNRRGRRIRMDQPAGLATPSHIRIG
jgi:hypothetical protein